MEQKRNEPRKRVWGGAGDQTWQQSPLCLWIDMARVKYFIAQLLRPRQFLLKAKLPTQELCPRPLNGPPDRRTLCLVGGLDRGGQCLRSSTEHTADTASDLSVVLVPFTGHSSQAHLPLSCLQLDSVMGGSSTLFIQRLQLQLLL